MSLLPAPLWDVPKPSELEPRESEVADAPLLDRAEPVAEQRSSPRRRLSRSLDVEMASLFWVSEGSLHVGGAFGCRSRDVPDVQSRPEAAVPVVPRVPAAPVLPSGASSS